MGDGSKPHMLTLGIVQSIGGQVDTKAGAQGALPAISILQNLGQRVSFEAQKIILILDHKRTVRYNN